MQTILKLERARWEGQGNGSSEIKKESKERIIKGWVESFEDRKTKVKWNKTRNFHFNNWFNVPSQMYWNKMCYNFMFPEQASILSTSQSNFVARRHSTQHSDENEKKTEEKKKKGEAGEIFYWAIFLYTQKWTILKIIKRRKLLWKKFSFFSFLSFVQPEITPFDVGRVRT